MSTHSRDLNQTKLNSNTLLLNGTMKSTFENLCHIWAEVDPTHAAHKEPTAQRHERAVNQFSKVSTLVTEQTFVLNKLNKLNRLSLLLYPITFPQ